VSSHKTHGATTAGLELTRVIRSLKARGEVVGRLIDKRFKRFCGNVAGLTRAPGQAPGALFLSPERPYAEFIIHALTPPASGGGIAVDMNILGIMSLTQRGPFIGRRRFAVPNFKLTPIGPQKPPAPALVPKPLGKIT